MFLFKRKLPSIQPSGSHPMKPSMVDIDALKIMERLRKSGFDAYLVGGCVRDILLGKKVKDFDVVTNARPGQIKRMFKRCFIVGKRFHLAHVYYSSNQFVEVATFRAMADSDEERVRKFGKNNVFGTIEEDALRRDFTVNALYFNSADSSIIDYTGGFRDLRKKVLRSIGEPEERFTDDPVRIIRAARFCAQLGFSLSAKDFKSAKKCAFHIKEANAHRLLDELYKILRCGASAITFQYMRRFGLLKWWMPELSFEDKSNPFIRRLEAIDRRRRDGEDIPACVLLAAMMFDLIQSQMPRLGEPVTFQEALDTIRSKCHDIAQKLSVPRREWERLSALAARQWSFAVIPPSGRRKRGKNRFFASESFMDALKFFEIISEAEDVFQSELVYWKRKSEEGAGHHEPVSPERPHDTITESAQPRSETTGEEKPKKKRKRKRKSRRPKIHVNEDTVHINE